MELQNYMERFNYGVKRNKWTTPFSCTRIRLEGFKKTWKLLRNNLVRAKILNLDFRIRSRSANNYTFTLLPYYVIGYNLHRACQCYHKSNTTQNPVMLVWHKKVTIPTSHHYIIFVHVFVESSNPYVYSYNYDCFLNKLCSSIRH